MHRKVILQHLSLCPHVSGDGHVPSAEHKYVHMSTFGYDGGFAGSNNEFARRIAIYTRACWGNEN